MKREEAIKLIDTHTVCFYNEIDSPTLQALHLAIEALHNDSDLISRADAIGAVHKYYADAIDKTPHEIDEDGDDVYTDMKAVNELLEHNKYISKAIKALPSAEPYRIDPDGTAWVNAQGQDLDKVGRVILDNYPYAKTFYPDRPRGEWGERRLEHDREWIIGCIKHDGFIKTDRFDKANQIILDSLQTEVVRCKDCKNWRESHSEDDESYCYLDGRTTDSTDYCSWGERREE